ncbi:MAG TPA: penicillin-binding transpeptidase domain-containing protein [Candidatus Limnocylindrales bacterium]|nr:penicillin-binding transpeptidase domain-containing protein [Candidatus Limnocylindrales bacterium]
MSRPIGRNIRALALAIALAFLATSLGVGYWSLVASADLARDPFNPRLVAALQDRPRGRILAQEGSELAVSARVGDAFRRSYAEGSLAQVVGYASFRYGASGIEAAYAESLIGRDPADPLAQWRARYLRQYGEPNAVVLGIDPAVQRAAVEALGGRRGAVVAIDVRTGRILASVSLPAYDPNLIADPATEEQAWAQVNDDPGRPLLNRVAQGLYAPGSIFKIVTAAAALESGLDPERRIRVDDPFQADASWGDYSVRSATGAHGDFDLSLAMQRSENIYFAKVGLEIGGAALAEWAERFGIGAAPELDLPAGGGQLSNTGDLDRPILVADTSFGQGELLVSPLQMALVVATIARGGSQPTPHYATSVRDAEGGVLRAIEPGAAGQIVNPRTALTLGRVLVEAVSAPGAFAAGARVPGLLVGGKTGTAENPQGAPHGWFVGFAPAEAPTVAVAVVIENAERGGEDAAPVGGAVLRAAAGNVSRGLLVPLE